MTIVSSPSTQFGGYIRTYSSNAKSVSLWLLVPTCVILGFIAYWLGQFNLLVELILVGLIIFLIALSLQQQRRSTYQVQIFEDGLISIRGKQAQQARWDSIATIWKNFPVQFSRRTGYVVIKRTYTLVCRTGERITLTDVIHTIEGLGNDIEQRVLPYVMPSLIEAYKRGEVLQFDRLGISQAGLSDGSETVPWYDITSFMVIHSRISIMRAGMQKPWIQMEVAKIPNFFIVETLLRELCPHSSTA